jgi:hypothetical protein
MRSNETVFLAMVRTGRIDDGSLACAAHRATAAFQAVHMAIAGAQVAVRKVLVRHPSPLGKCA